MKIGDILDIGKTDVLHVELSTYSWVGLSLGAQHTYGELIQQPKHKRIIELEHEITPKRIAKYVKGRREMGLSKKDDVPYAPGDLCNGFDDLNHICRHAKKVWKDLFPSAQYLVYNSVIIDVREQPTEASDD